MADRGCSCPLPHSLSDLRGWRSCWGGFTCFAPRRPQKYEGGGTEEVFGAAPVKIPGEIGSITLDVLNQTSVLPPIMCAPPSSPASFGGIIESAALFQPSPTRFLTFLPEGPSRSSMQGGRRMDTDAGSSIIESALVTPPIYSTLTTASATPLSTAPFTPPPELAHLTTPPSPEVPFAQVLVPPSDMKGSLSEQVHEHFGLQSRPPSNPELIHHIYSCSPMDRLVTSRTSPEMLSSLPQRVSLEENASLINIFVSDYEDTPFIGFGMASCENVSDKQSLEQALQPDNIFFERLDQSAEIQQTNAVRLPKEDDMNMSIENNIFGCWDQQGDRGDTRECCRRCGELSATCKDLFEVLKQMREKLTMIERRVDSIDERECRFKQLMQWMQEGEKVTKASILELSTEYS